MPATAGADPLLQGLGFDPMANFAQAAAINTNNEKQGNTGKEEEAKDDHFAGLFQTGKAVIKDLEADKHRQRFQYNPPPRDAAAKPEGAPGTQGPAPQ